jgi:hypothetical protein
VKGWSEQQTDKPSVEGHTTLKTMVDGKQPRQRNPIDRRTDLVNQMALENIQPKYKAVKLRIYGQLADICDTIDYLRKVDQ